MQCEDFFDFIEDLIDFQIHENFPSPQIPAIAGDFCYSAAAAGRKINFEDYAFCEDNEIINQDWLPNVFEYSEIKVFNPIEIRSESPISILETNIPLPKSGTRTKRPRSQAILNTSTSLTRRVPEPEMEEKRMRCNIVDGDTMMTMKRKCLHCESQKTPQWRAGPMGPKTLCNACGVRYKSGRLYPEYRPASSPSFIPYIHSNSHKKVVEMRQQRDDKLSFAL